uniref:G-protein coupled receptors family 1 profile domain-containing protein n=1 Tax=Ditylenchus dipsaci TaxID=166011 RepID=A0A915E477_9BILA
MLAIFPLVPNSLTIFICWKPAGDYLTNGPLVFWTSVWMISVTSSIPLAVFFLTLDRILFISFPMKYK